MFRNYISVNRQWYECETRAIYQFGEDAWAAARTLMQTNSAWEYCAVPFILHPWDPLWICKYTQGATMNEVEIYHRAKELCVIRAREEMPKCPS